MRASQSVFKMTPCGAGQNVSVLAVIFVQSFYEIRYAYLSEPEIKVSIGRILVWWSVTISSQIPGLMLILCHIMRHTSEDAQ